MQNIELYKSSLRNALDNMAPLVTKLIHFRESQPWYNSNLQTSTRLCRKLENLWKKKSKLTVHKLAFEEQYANFNKLLLKSKKSYILSSIENNIKDTSKLYKVMKKLLQLNHQRNCHKMSLLRNFHVYLQTSIKAKLLKFKIL